MPLALPRGLEWWRGRPGGADWLDRLPLLASECAEEWKLRLGAPFEPATVSLVVPATLQDGSAAVLKVGFPEPESAGEPDALAAWEGLRPREATFYLNRGVAHFGLRQYDKAIADYDEVLKIDSRISAAYNNRCLSRAVLGQEYPKAIADCAEALQLQPNDPYAHDNLGIIHLKQGDYAKAITEFNASLKLDAQRPRALYGRGLAKSKSGDAAGGNSDMGAARTLQPAIGEEFTNYGVR